MRETASSPEILMLIYQITQCHIPKYGWSIPWEL